MDLKFLTSCKEDLQNNYNKNVKVKVLKKLFFYFFISVIFFGLLFKIEYATDTYSVFNFDKQAIFNQYAMSGRFISAVVGKIVKTLNLSEQEIYLGSFVLAIACAVLSQYMLYTIIEKNVENIIIRLIIPTLIIINPFSIELFLYIEKGIMWFGILMCIAGVKSIVSFFETNKRKYILFAAILIFIANCSYQGIVGIFVSITLVFILKYSNSIKQFIINNFIVGSVYVVPAVLDFLIMKLIFKTSRINGNVALIESVKKILKYTIEMYIKMYNLLPKYAFILLILFTFTVFCSKIWKEKKIVHILKILYLIIGITIFAVAPHFIQPTDLIWFVPRSTYSFASMYGIIVLYLVMNYEINGLFKKVIIAISCFFILFQAQKFIKIEKDRYILNKKDENITMIIIEQINNYEKQTGKRITQVSIFEDEKPNYTYNGIFATGDMNIKCYSTNWSAIEILKYYSKKDLKLVEKDKEIELRFKNRNWDEFSFEQIIFKDNTINICNF